MPISSSAYTHHHHHHSVCNLHTAQPLRISSASARKLSSSAHTSSASDIRRAVLVQNLIGRIHAEQSSSPPSPSPPSSTSTGMPTFARLSPANRIKRQREEALKAAAAASITSSSSLSTDAKEQQQSASHPRS